MQSTRKNGKQLHKTKQQKMDLSIVEKRSVSFSIQNCGRFRFWEARGGLRSGLQGIDERSCWLHGFLEVVEEGKGQRMLCVINKGDANLMWLLLLTGYREIWAFGGLRSDERESFPCALITVSNTATHRPQRLTRNWYCTKHKTKVATEINIFSVTETWKYDGGHEFQNRGLCDIVRHV